MPEFDRIARRQRPMHTKRTGFVMKRLDGASVLFDDTERIVADADLGLLTIEDRSVYVAGCGHLCGLHNGPADLGGVCAKCGTTMCSACATLRCRRCLCLLCPDDARVWDTVVFCNRCRWILRGQIALRLGMASIHDVLSKDIHS